MVLKQFKDSLTGTLASSQTFTKLFQSDCDDLFSPGAETLQRTIQMFIVKEDKGFIGDRNNRGVNLLVFVAVTKFKEWGTN